MPRQIRILTDAEIQQLPARAREVVEYRKSGLSLNHVQGIPLDCAYCIRHTYGLWDQRQPTALMTDAQAVQELVSHRYFRPHRTPLQLFNRATDPFLPTVAPHTLAVLRELDARGLRNHVLVITRYKLTDELCERLNEVESLRLTLLFTYSGIADRRVEPYPSHVAAESMALATERAGRYRTIFYWRPLVPGLNDSTEQLARGVELSRQAHATVFTGLFYRAEIAEYYRANGIPEPYEADARRKIVPETLERRVLDAFRAAGTDAGTPFRKTSCAVSYVHGQPDYNGHYGIRELCDICPIAQVARCRAAHRQPTTADVDALAAGLPEMRNLKVLDITDRAVMLSGLESEHPRYFLQHGLAFQVHDEKHPHHRHRHGRAEIGWRPAAEEDQA